MSSKYTTTNELVNGRNMSSISLMKVAREFINPKGITNHSKRPSLALKEVFHTSEGLIGTWWYPDFKSILMKYFAPLQLVQKFINLWDRVSILDCDLFQCLIFNTECQSPIFYTNTIGLPQGDELGQMWTFCSSSLICLLILLFSRMEH